MEKQKESNCLFHTWTIIKDTGTMVYRECKKCGVRDSKKYAAPKALHAIDTQWVKGGKFN